MKRPDILLPPSMRSRSEESSDEDRYTRRSDRYDVTSGESSDDSDSGGTTSSSESSSYEESAYTSSDDMSSDYDSLRDDVDISIMAEDIDALSVATERPSILGGLLDSACGWLDRPMSCIGLAGGPKEVSLLRESKFNHATAARQIKLNETISKATKKAISLDGRKNLSPEERRRSRLERKGLLDTEDFSTKFMPQEEGSITSHRVRHDDRRVRKGDKSNEEEGMAVLKKDLPVQVEEVEAAAAEGGNDKVNKDETRENETAPASADDGERAEREEVTASEEKLEPIKSARLREKELKTMKKRRIQAWKSRMREQKAEESDPKEEIIVVDEDQRTEEEDPAKDADIVEQADGTFKFEESNEDAKPSKVLETIVPPNPSGEWQTATKLENADASTPTEEKDAPQFSELQLPESEDILSVTMKNDDVLGANDTASSPLQEVSEQHTHRAAANHKDDDDVKSITDLTHITDAPEENLADISLPELTGPPHTIKAKTSRSSRRKTKKTQPKVAKVDVIDVFELDDEDSWTPGEVRDPSPSRSHSQATHQSRRGETARDPTPSKSMRSAPPLRMARDPSAPRGRASSPLKMKSEHVAEDYASSIWEEEAQKLDQKSTQLDFSSAWDTKSKTAVESFSQHRRSRLERTDSREARKSRSKSREGRSATPHPDDAVRSSHSRASRKATREPDTTVFRDTNPSIQPSFSQHSDYESPKKKKNSHRESRPQLEHRQRAMESANAPKQLEKQNDPWEHASSTPSKIRDFVQIRSIDDAQTGREPLRRPLKEPHHGGLRIHRTSSRDSKEEAQGYTSRADKTPEPIDVHQYMAHSGRQEDRTVSRTVAADDGLHRSRSRETPIAGHSSHSKKHQDSSTRSKPQDRSYLSRENSEHVKEMTVLQSLSRETHRSSRSRPGERHALPETPAEVLDDYHMIRKVKSRESRRENRDGRDDSDTRRSKRSSRSRRSEKGGSDGYPRGVDHDERSSKKKERKSRGKEEPLSASSELRKLEKKIEKQLMQVKKEQKAQEWDEQSQVSAKDLRRLEKQLVQRLWKEDEKRAAKLKRIRRRHESSRFPRDEGKTIPDKVRSAAPVKSIHQKAADLREKSKYDQLKVLRTSRPAMRRYMSGSRGSSPAPERVEILG